MGPDTYHHGDLPRALVDAALELIGERGPVGFTLREAARRVGVSHAAPYRHFPDKDALLQAVAEEGFTAMRDEMVGAIRGTDDPATRFQALGITYVRFAIGHPSHFRVMFGPGGARDDGSSLAAVKEETFRLLLAAIADCQAGGVVREGPPEELAVTAWSAVHGLASLLVDGVLPRSGGKASVEDLARLVTQTLMDGMRRPG
jgi:AcrR family transcriptional regulator